MYSEQLEALVKSIIADGKITEKERAVLHKKAEAEGVDADEIDIYTEGLITQMINDGRATTFVSEHDPDLFIKETCGREYEPIYYKLKKVYELDAITSRKHDVRDIQISFIDVTDANNKEHTNNWERFMGMGLLFSVNEKEDKYNQNPTICFSTDGDEILSLFYDWDFDYFQLQNIGNKPAFKTWGYKIDKEQLQVLCDAKDIQVRFQKNDNKHISLTETSLPGFQYYAQYFYRVMIDPEAYPDAENKLTEVLKEATREEMSDIKEQQVVAGILSRKVKGKWIKPTPYYMSQYKVLDAVITDVRGRIVTQESNDYDNYTPHLFLHAVTKKENEHKFYLCLTCHLRSKVQEPIILSINLQDHTIFPVTDNMSFLAKKNPHKENDNEYYNFYYIDNETLKAFLNAQDLTLKFESEEHKIRSIPQNWKKAVTLLSMKNGLKKWADETGGFSKFCQTYSHFCQTYSHKKIVFIVLAIIILMIIFF